MSTDLVLLALLMGAVTYPSRALPLLAPGMHRLPARVQEYLRLVGPAILATLAAVTVIVATDTKFYEHMPQVWHGAGAKENFENLVGLSSDTELERLRVRFGLEHAESILAQHPIRQGLGQHLQKFTPRRTLLPRDKELSLLLFQVFFDPFLTVLRCFQLR